MIYSHKNQYPKPLPFRITLQNGQTRTDPTTFTPEELLDAGYIAVPYPPNIQDSQALEWSNAGEWVVRDKTPTELVAETEFSAAAARQQRNKLLQESDWTQVIDAPVNQFEWKTYRQALRDITTQLGFPYDIVWPIAPK